MTAKELRDLGIEVTLDDRSRVLFSGDKTTIATANLWLRTADRVKIIVGEFPAKTFDELFEGVYALEWEDLLPFGAKFPLLKQKQLNLICTMSQVFKQSRKSSCQKITRTLP